MSNHEEPDLPPKGQLLVYRAEDGQVKIDVRLENDTVWLTQQQMADLFQTTKQNIGQHLKNIFEGGELAENSVVKDFFTTAADGKQYRTRHYNLDAVISVGYRVKSTVATRFRIWATQKLREFIVKGFVLDDERLKNPDQPFDYFDELLRRIQDIRTSERRFYQKITDILRDEHRLRPDPAAKHRIFPDRAEQNALGHHWQNGGGNHPRQGGQRQDQHGLDQWARCEGAKARRDYRQKLFERTRTGRVEQYLVFAEGQAMRRVPMHMKDWIIKLHAFLTLNDRNILTHAGKISHDMAKELAETEYEKFNQKRIQQEDAKGGEFEKAITQLPPPAQKRGEKK